MGLQTMSERIGDFLVIMTLVGAVFGALHQFVIVFFHKIDSDPAQILRPSVSLRELDV